MTTFDPGKITATLLSRWRDAYGDWVYHVIPPEGVRVEAAIVMTGEEVQNLIVVTAAAAVLAARDDLNRSMVRVTTDVAQDISQRVQKALSK